MCIYIHIYVCVCIYTHKHIHVCVRARAQVFHGWRSLVFHAHWNGFIRLWRIFNLKVEISHLNAIYNFSYITVWKRPDDDSQLVPKRVSVNKLIQTGVVCDWFDTYACDLLTPTGCFIWKNKVLRATTENLSRMPVECVQKDVRVRVYEKFWVYEHIIAYTISVSIFS